MFAGHPGFSLPKAKWLLPFLHPALFSSGPALATFTLLSSLQFAGWFAAAPATHHHRSDTFPCLYPPGSRSCCVLVSQGPAYASDPAK